MHFNYFFVTCNMVKWETVPRGRGNRPIIGRLCQRIRKQSGLLWTLRMRSPPRSRKYSNDDYEDVCKLMHIINLTTDCSVIIAPHSTRHILASQSSIPMVNTELEERYWKSPQHHPWWLAGGS